MQALDWQTGIEKLIPKSLRKMLNVHWLCARGLLILRSASRASWCISRLYLTYQVVTLASCTK